MGSILLRLIILIIVLWVLRRFLGSLLGRPKQSAGAPDPGGRPNNMVKDPVCGMYMDSRLAVRLENRKELFYFCSEECKNKYLGKHRGEAGTSAPM